MKKTQQNLIRMLCIIFLLQLSNIINAQQIYVNREWRTNYGDPVFNPLLSPYGGDWTKSIVTSTNDIVTVGHTAVSGQGENLLVSRYSQDGSLIWQTDYNSSSIFNDYGIDVIEDASGNIYVCGVSDNGGITNTDIIILMYDANGNLQNSTSFDGTNSMNDISSAIKLDGNGNVLISGASEDPTTGYDYLIVSYDPNLNFNWKNSYDYAGLYDFAASLEIDNGKIMIGGASASSSTDWDYAVAYFNPSSGSYQGDTRDNLPGVGFDEIYAFTKDAAGNTYATGKASSNGTNYDIRTLKISPTNTIVWTQTYDAFGAEDIGSTLVIDTNGDVIVGGFITKSNNKKDGVIIKYDGATGNLIWKYNQPSHDINSDAVIKKLTLNTTNNNIHFIGGDKELNSNKRAIVGELLPNSKLGWLKYIKGNYDYLPSDIQYGGFGTPGIYAIAIKDSTTNAYELNYFTEHPIDTSIIYSTNGSPICAKNQMIVCFDTSALIKPMIDNPDIVAGPITDFIKQSVVNQIQSNLATICESDRCDIKVFKIFPEITTSKTVTTSRLGETIPIPEFYSVLLLQFPNLNIVNATNSLLNLFPTLKYCDLNFACTLSGDNFTEDSFHNYKGSSPALMQSNYSETDFFKTNNTSANDSVYPYQSSLHATAFFTVNNHVNVEEAWDYENGKRFVKVGVFDTGINWTHPDFMDNTKTITKIKGWDFLTNVDLTSQSLTETNGDAEIHGTQVAGIIGANRNNTIGVAGIAGGNFFQSTFLDSSGVRLYGMKTVNMGTNSVALVSDMSKGIIGSSIDNPSNTTYEYGLHINNHSWRVTSYISGLQAYMTDTNMTLLREAVHFANRAKVTFVAATGNQNASYPCYPATIDDDWVLTVGATGVTGDKATISNYKNNIDLCAPGVLPLVRTTIPYIQQFGSYYTASDGTSMSAPHVAAAAGLLMSYYNKPYSDPSNLAPEDVEFILQNTATDINLPNADDSTGYGRLNIGKALKLINKPKRKVKHFGTDNSGHFTLANQYSTNDTVKLTERYKNAAGQWFVPNKKYVINSWRILTFVYHGLSPSDTIINFWRRHSSTNVLEAWSYVNGKKVLRPRERLASLYCNYNQASTEGYIYHVRDSAGNFLGWWPFDTSAVQTKMKLTYSVLVEDTAFDVGINKIALTKPEIKVFPNPTKENQTLEITVNKPTSCKLEIFDLIGRNVYSVDKIKLIDGANRIPLPTGSFTNGMYIVNIRIEESKYYYKVLKE